MFFVFRRWPALRRLGVAVFALPLMFAGGSLVGNLAAQSVGGVGELEISRQEFAAVYQSLAERYLARYDLDELPPELARAAAGQARSRLVSEYLIRAAAADRQIEPPDSAVAAEIRATPEFQDESGNFSVSLFQDYVRDTRRLETEVRRNLRRRALLAAANPGEIPAVREKLAAYRRQLRVAEETSLTVTTAFNIGEDDIARYYSENQNEYQIREEADWEYIVVSAAAPDAGPAPDADTMSLAFAELEEEYAARERRTVRHIFISGEDDDARERAAELAQQARASPETFADLAREFSEDAGSAANGGDLGVVVRGDLPAAMEDEAFLLESGEVGEPVLVDGGYSVLQAEVSAAPAPEAEDLRAEAEARARRIIVRDELAERVERLQEVAHINIGSLEPVAAEAGVLLQTAVSVPRNSAAAEADDSAPAFFADESILAQLFSEEVLSGGETSPAIALNDDEYLMARAARYQPARVRPLTEVGEGIARRIAAREQIGVMLEDAAAGDGEIAPANAEWRGPWTLSLLGEEDESPPEIDDAARGEIFAAALDGGFPAFALVPGDGIVHIFRIREAIDAPPRADDVAAIGRLLAESGQSAAVNAYLQVLAENYEVYFDDEPLQSPY